MNKLSILTILCLVALATCYDYEFEIGFSNKEFETEDSKGFLQIEDVNKRLTTYTWKLPLKPNTVHTANTNVAYLIEDIKSVLFNFEKFPNGNANHIFLSHVNVIPKYIQNPIQRALKTKRLCHPNGRNQKVLSKVDVILLKECN